MFEPLGSFHLFQVTNRFTAIVLAGSGRRAKAVKLNATRERKGVGERNVEVEVTWRLPRLPDPSTVSSDEHWSALGARSTHRRAFPPRARYLPSGVRECVCVCERERERERNGQGGIYASVHCPVNFETTFGKRVPPPSECTDRDCSVIGGELWKIRRRGLIECFANLALCSNERELVCSEQDSPDEEWETQFAAAANFPNVWNSLTWLIKK